MIDVKDLIEVFREKLLRTGSLDAAFTKAVWIAYKAGLKDGSDDLRQIEHRHHDHATKTKVQP